MSPLRTRIIPTAFLLVLGLAAGAIAAFFIRGGFTATGQDDPCFGHGELVGSRTYTVTEQSARNAETFQRDVPTSERKLNLTPGEEREVRTCRESPIKTILIDGQTGVIVGQRTTINEAIAFYEEHPDELPGVKTREEFWERYQESFIPADVPADLTAGCDPSWVKTTFEQIGAVMCHPADWSVVSDTSLEAGVGNEAVEVFAIGAEAEAPNTTCTVPTTIRTPSGTATVCAIGPSAYARVSYGINLPNAGRASIIVYNEASSEEELVALQVAASMEPLQ